jgi:hypothetical protein
MLRRTLPLLFAVSFVVLLGGCNLVPVILGSRGTLNVEVSFAGAEGQLEKVEITVDEKFRGNIDPDEGHVFFDLTAGEHLLLVTCPGFLPYSRLIQVDRGANNLLIYVELKKQPQQ